MLRHFSWVLLNFCLSTRHIQFQHDDKRTKPLVALSIDTTLKSRVSSRKVADMTKEEFRKNGIFLRVEMNVTLNLSWTSGTLFEKNRSSLFSSPWRSHSAKHTAPIDVSPWGPMLHGRTDHGPQHRARLT